MGEKDTSQDRTRQFIANHVDEMEPTRRRVLDVTRKNRTLNYFLKKETDRIRVCPKYFLALFDVTENFFRVYLESKIMLLLCLLIKGVKPLPRTKSAILENTRQHILSIPTVESHYCRKSSKKLYLSPELNLEKLYHLYLRKCGDENKETEAANLVVAHKQPIIQPVSKSLYKQYFYSYGNLTFHTPQKDQFSTCNRYNGLSEEYKAAEQEEYIKTFEK